LTWSIRTAGFMTIYKVKGILVGRIDPEIGISKYLTQVVYTMGEGKISPISLKAYIKFQYPSHKSKQQFFRKTKSVL